MPSAEPVRLLRGVDQAAFVAALGERLRSVGVPVTLTALTTFTRALDVCPPTHRERLYWTARVSLVSQPQHLPVFDEVFAAVFGDAVLAVDPHTRRLARSSAPDERDVLAPVPAAADQDEPGAGLPWHTLPRVVEPAEESSAGPLLPELLPSAVEAFVDTPFEQLDEAQLAVLGAWLERSLTRWPTRRSRRQRVRRRGGRVALRETIARSRRTGFEPVELSRYRRLRRPRTVTLLADVSQSMQSYSTAYLHLMRAFARSGRAETFAFSTSLTRLTPVLAHTSAQVAIEQASEQVVDRYGGTHLAESLRTLMRSRHAYALRGGVLVIASDGWDSDEPELLAEAMTRVRRRVRRVVWLNPRAAAPGYEPLVGSMAAALPMCDAFLAADTVRSMGEAFEAIVAD